MDQGVPGQYNASHAEKQAIVNNPGGVHPINARKNVRVSLSCRQGGMLGASHPDAPWHRAEMKN
ncbi:hypothetical protein [Ralstonia solanacearum]|uniref:hypothetical protein n=1 Tax=Ralstonia solanacearum TaxID=305 RepID=UPI003CC66C11